jgi:hypothetical protein
MDILETLLQTNEIISDIEVILADYLVSCLQLEGVPFLRDR